MLLLHLSCLKLCANCLFSKFRATPYGANKRCLYFFCCHAQATCGKRPEGWKVLRGVVEPSAPAQAEAEAYGAAHTSFKRENDDLAAADPSDWLQVAFGSRTAPNTCSEKGNGKPKARDTKVALPASKSAARLQQASEMMQAFFVEVENEPPDSSHLDATGRAYNGVYSPILWCLVTLLLYMEVHWAFGRQY